MSRPSAEELAALYAGQHWRRLWEHALPLVKFTIGRLRKTGQVAAHHVDADFNQEGNLAAGCAVRSWDPERSAFSSWVILKVEGALRNHVARSINGIVGGRDAHVQTGAYEESPVDDFVDELEQEEDYAVEQRLYEEVWRSIPAVDKDLVRMRFGLEGSQSVPMSEIVVSLGIAERTARRRLKKILQNVAGLEKSRESYMHTRGIHD